MIAHNSFMHLADAVAITRWTNQTTVTSPLDLAANCSASKGGWGDHVCGAVCGAGCPPSQPPRPPSTSPAVAGVQHQDSAPAPVVHHRVLARLDVEALHGHQDPRLQAGARVPKGDALTYQLQPKGPEPRPAVMMSTQQRVQGRGRWSINAAYNTQSFRQQHLVSCSNGGGRGGGLRHANAASQQSWQRGPTQAHSANIAHRCRRATAESAAQVYYAHLPPPGDAGVCFGVRPPPGPSE